MATEKQLIEANALIEYLKNLSFEGGTKTRSQAGNEVLHIHMPQIIQQAPIVDAVEVVRCKDCRFCAKHPTSDKVKLCTNENWNTEYYPFARDDGFCSYGERGDGDGD